jgi:ribose transport system substrate-binding protein
LRAFCGSSRRSLVAVVVATSLLLAACGSSGSSSSSSTQSGASGGQSGASGGAGKTLRIAYLSFVVANPYDAPMLAAAKSAAAANNAKLTVFDANNDPNAQYSQFQNVLAAGKGRYDGIIVQPIFGAALMKVARTAIAGGFKVANLDQILGTNLDSSAPQVKGLAANVVFVPTQNGIKMGQQAVAACAHVAGACKVGYLYGVKASSVDAALRAGFDSTIRSHPNIRVVATGESLYSTQGGLTATQNMLQAQPGINLIVGADQAVAGARLAIAAAHKQVMTIGTGGSAIALQAVKSGSEFASVMQLPATEGRLVVQDLVRAIRSGHDVPSRAPATGLPDNGVATMATESRFRAEWPG